jgi:hypothetical protein
MSLTFRRVLASTPLNPADEAMLRDGPGPPHYRLPEPEEHDRLRTLWATHGPAITAALPRGKKAWFPERDAFVRWVRANL